MHLMNAARVSPKRGEVPEPPTVLFTRHYSLVLSEKHSFAIGQLSANNGVI